MGTNVKAPPSCLDNIILHQKGKVNRFFKNLFDFFQTNFAVYGQGEHVGVLLIYYGKKGAKTGFSVLITNVGCGVLC